MNGIFGILNLDGQPASADQLLAMQEALAFWAVDGAQRWQSGEIGMGCLHLVSTPEAEFERLPFHDRSSGLTLTAGARLDNRAELLNQLKIETGGAQDVVTDSEIILHAYRRWGKDCVHHMEGDWHFVIWDARKRTLFLARDHHGSTGLYYYQDPHCFAFASSKKALLALAVVPKEPNLLRLSQVLSSWPGDGIQTAYKNIQRLPPAHHMSITAEGIKIERYWFPENVSRLHLKSDEAYVEAFLDVFTTAVSARLRSRRPTGVMLSGGLDSGSVMAVAAAELKKRGQRLFAFTSVPLSDPSPYISRRRFGDETRLAQAAARQAGNVEHHLIKAESITPLAGIKHMLWVHDEPGHAAANQFWIAATMEDVRRRGIGALLTGQTGNATISWTGSDENLLPLLQTGNIVRFWRAFESARRNADLSRWGGARRHMLKPLLRPVWPLWFEIKKRWSPAAAPWREYSAIHPEFAAKIDLSRHMIEAGYYPGLVLSDPIQRRLAIIQSGTTIVGANWCEKGSAYGLEVRDPTQDRRVIELCLAIPDSQYHRDGVARRFIREAMQGYLPDDVRLNKKRGLQAADLGRRVLDSHAEIEASLADLRAHELSCQVLDLDRMAAVLTSMAQGLTPRNTDECAAVLLRGLMVGLFLLRFE